MGYIGIPQPPLAGLEDVRESRSENIVGCGEVEHTTEFTPANSHALCVSITPADPKY